VFWSGRKIKQHLSRVILENAGDEASIDCNAYTLHIGNEVHVSADVASNEDTLKTTLKEKQHFSIPPGQFAFLLTKESVSIPATAMAFINVKSKIKLRGLVNVSGFHVDPGYNGRLVISVYNASPSPIVLAEGQPCFLIWFADLDDGDALNSQTEGNVTAAYTKSGHGFRDLPPDVYSHVTRRNVSISTLSEEVKSVKQKTEFMYNITLGIGVPFLIALMVAAIQLVMGDAQRSERSGGLLELTTSFARTLMLPLTLTAIVVFTYLFLRVIYKLLKDKGAL
jgi:dCTP deaminase